MLHTDLWENIQFCNLSDRGKLVYIGLITLADDEGRFRANPQLLCSKLFPMGEMRASEMTKHLISIKKCNLVTIWEVNGERYGCHPKWEKYQKLRTDRIKSSKIPLPNDNQGTTKCPPNINKDNINKDNIASDKKRLVDKMNINK